MCITRTGDIRFLLHELQLSCPYYILFKNKAKGSNINIIKKKIEILLKDRLYRGKSKISFLIFSSVV